MRTIFAVTAIMLLLAGSAMAEQGITEDKILLGQSCVLQGYAASLGNGMSAGLNVYFDHINSQGGVQGRKIELITQDDGYEPLQAIKVTRDLVSNRQVFCLIGEVGTPTSKAVLPLVEQEQIPFVAPFTGAELLRSPFKKWVVNVRGSYNQEMEKLAEYLCDKQGMKRIACFYQDDAYGKAGLGGIEKALTKRGLSLCGTGTYQRNSLAIQTGLASIRSSKPEAVVMVGAYTPCAAFIKSAKAPPEMQGVAYCNISFVGTEALKKALGDAAEGCIVSQVVPYPWDQSIPMIKEYTQMMTEAGRKGEIGFVSLEGFMAAKFFCQVMDKIEGEPTREKFVQCVETVGKFDLGGVELGFGPSDHQGMDKVFLVRFDDGKIALAE